MKIQFSIILLVLLLTACRHEKKMTPDVSLSGDTVTENAAASEKVITGDVFRGLFVVGRNMLSFRLCDDPEQDYAVVDSTHRMKELYKTVFLHTPAFPYEYVYVEVKGELGEADELLTAKGFDGVIIVKDVLTFEAKNYQNTCIPYDFWALGESWSLQVSAREGILVLKDFSSMKVFVFEYFAPKNMSDEVLTYSSNNYAMQASIKAVFRKEACESGEADNPFQYSASVLINGKRYIGCAVRGMNE